MNEDHENDFLIRQLREARELASDSDLVDIRPLGQRTYAALFRCNGLVQERDGTVRGADRFVIEIQLAEDHLRTKPGPLVMRIVYPPNCFAPNVAPPLMCAGDLPAGVGVVDLVFQAYEIISWQNCTIDERDALNHAACQWARSNPDRYPVDTRPLKWKQPQEVTP